MAPNPQRSSPPSGTPYKQRLRERQRRPRTGRLQFNRDDTPEDFLTKIPVAYTTGLGDSPASSHDNKGEPVLVKRFPLLHPSLLADGSDDGHWEHLVMSQGEEDRVRSQSPGAVSVTSSGSQFSETWDYGYQPSRTDTLETQAPTFCDIQRCQTIGAPNFPTEAYHTCRENEFNTETENQLSSQEEFESGDENTPSESSDDQINFSNEAEADRWLKSRFNDEEVQNIKAFWTWSTTHVNWIHHDEETNEIIEWPKDLV